MSSWILVAACLIAFNVGFTFAAFEGFKTRLCVLFIACNLSEMFFPHEGNKD